MDAVVSAELQCSSTPLDERADRRTLEAETHAPTVHLGYETARR